MTDKSKQELEKRLAELQKEYDSVLEDLYANIDRNTKFRFMLKLVYTKLDDMSTGKEKPSLSVLYDMKDKIEAVLNSED